MTERKPNKPTPIDTWKSIVECFSAKSYPWNSRTDALGVMRNWVFEMLKELRLSRGIDIDRHRIYYFFKKLQTMDYTPEIAEGAQLWMEIGDWTHKGSNPTVELSDFFPTEEQIESVRKRMNRDKPEKGEAPGAQEAELRAMNEESQRVLGIAHDFVSEITRARGRYSYLDRTSIVADAYPILRTLETVTAKNKGETT